MKKTGIIFLVVLTLWSCEEEVPEVSFRIETQGFVLQEGFLNRSDTFPSFSHKLSGGIVSFSNNNKTYEFKTYDIGIEDYEFHLPSGTYQLACTIPRASLYGQQGGSFIVHPGEVTIDPQTSSISVRVEANCSLFLVNDELNQLDKGLFMIERHSFAHGYYWSYPLFKDSLSGLNYTYFTPDTIPSNPSAFLWFYGGKPGIEEGGFATKDLEIGYQYYISILD